MSSNNKYLLESLWINAGKDFRLHVKRVRTDTALGKTPILLVHGAVENGRIFYSDSGRGLAPFLAQNGYDVFVADLRGRGLSTPRIDRNANHGQHESICEDLPLLHQKILEMTGTKQAIWMAHSWGGVLMASTLARFPGLIRQVSKMVFFGTKRSVRVHNLKRWLMIDLVWNRIAYLFTFLVGYLPSKALKMGSDDETKTSHGDCVTWVKSKFWVDPQDGFEYGSSVDSLTFPPTLYLAGISDACLGHPKDVKRFMEETRQKNAEFQILGKEFGNLHNYGHIDMLTHPDCAKDHFLKVVEWLMNRR